MSSDGALEAMGRVLTSGVPHAVVASVDWGQLRAVYEARRRRPILEELADPSKISGRGAPADADPRTPSDQGIPDLASLDPVERLEAVVKRVATEVRGVLRLAPERPVDPEQGFFQMGMDSLMSVELKSRLERRLTMRLPSTLTFNHPTVAAVATFIESKLAAQVVGTGRAASPSTPDVERRGYVADVRGTVPAETASEDDLSEEQLERMLSERLAKVERSGGRR